MELDDLLKVLKSFADWRVEYVLIGAAALNIHGIIRATEDADVFLRPDEGNIERLRSALAAVFSDPEIAKITAEDLLGDYPAITYIAPGGLFWLDILTRLGEALSFDHLEAVTLDVRGVPVQVATPRTLYRMKRDTVRAKDRLDAAMLREAFDLSDED